MSQFLYKGFPSEVEVLSLKPFISTNEALAALGLQELKLADGTTAVFTPEELAKSLTTFEDVEVASAAEVIAEVSVEEAVEKPLKKKSKKAAADQDAAE